MCILPDISGNGGSWISSSLPPLPLSLAVVSPDVSLWKSSLDERFGAFTHTEREKKRVLDIEGQAQWRRGSELDL